MHPSPVLVGRKRSSSDPDPVIIKRSRSIGWDDAFFLDRAPCARNIVVKRSPSAEPVASLEELGLIRDAQFFYFDGNVLLVAQGVAFCLYQGLLTELSEIFRDMFSIPAGQANEMICGHPVVRLSDTAGALRELFSALFTCKRYDPSKDPELYSLSCIIRLAHKYNIYGLLDQSIRELKMLFPNTIQKWEAVRPIRYSVRAIAAVNLAHLTSTPSVLPSALYECCQLSGETLLAGTTHPDGTEEKLSPADLARCLAALPQLGQSQSNIAHTAFENDRCKRTVCTSVLKRLRLRAASYAASPSRRADTLMDWDAFVDTHVPGPGEPDRLCGDCVKSVRATVKTMRKEWWVGLPIVTGVTVEDWYAD